MDADRENKLILTIASAYSLMKVAWFVGKLLNVSLVQRVTNDGQMTFFEYFSETGSRASLYKISDLDLKPLKKFDYLLIIENFPQIDIQSFRNSHFINFITELKPGELSKKAGSLINRL